MLKLIVGTKGSGKTKTMIDMIDKATKTTSGNIVVIEKCMKLTTEINHAARLVDVDEYGVAGATASCASSTTIWTLPPRFWQRSTRSPRTLRSSSPCLPMPPPCLRN